MKPPKSFSLITFLFILLGFAELVQAYYNPETGNFLNRDPIEERGGENLYGFVRNDGVNAWDNLGLEFEKFTGDVPISRQRLADGYRGGKVQPNFKSLMVGVKDAGKCWQVTLSGKASAIMFINTHPDAVNQTDNFGRDVITHEKLHVTIIQTIYNNFINEVNPLEKYYMCNKPCAYLMQSWIKARSELISAVVDIANVEMDIVSYNSPEAKLEKPKLLNEIKILEDDANNIREKIINANCRLHDTCPN
jgi:hypothetical protein